MEGSRTMQEFQILRITIWPFLIIGEELLWLRRQFNESFLNKSINILKKIKNIDQKLLNDSVHSMFNFTYCSVHVLFSSLLIPVPVRTRMMASNPMDFSTSLLRSLRNCWPFNSTWKERNKGLRSDHKRAVKQKSILYHIHSICVSVHVIVYLEVAVLVDGAAGLWRHIAHGGYIHKLVRKQEEVDTTALRHTVFSQLLKHTPLRLEQSLTTHTHTHNSVYDFVVQSIVLP